VAVNRWEPAAIGRLVQVYGLYAAERMLGRRVWSAFGSYRKHISRPDDGRSKRWCNGDSKTQRRTS